MTKRLRRLSEHDWGMLDRALVAALLATVLLDVTLSHRHGPLVFNLLVTGAMAAGLLWRRRHPLRTAAVVAAGGAVLQIALTSPSAIASIPVVVVVASYSSGAHLDLRRALVSAALLLAIVAGVSVAENPSDIFFPVVFFTAVPWVVGRVIRTQTALARELTEKAEREQIAHEHEEARAAAAERARVARELHDVLAHNLSVMVIQAAAARRIAGRDPAAAVEAAELISRTGREALSELRFVFGPVRKEDGEELGASPGLANLDQLASRAHRAGLVVDVRVEGERLELSPGADMAAYRVVQEALTNTLKHAHGARAAVTVRYGPQDVVVEVVDDGTGPTSNGNGWGSGGHGLVGMRERVVLYGGELKVGSGPRVGFAVRARLPAEGVMA